MSNFIYGSEFTLLALWGEYVPHVFDHCPDDDFENGKSFGGHNLQDNIQITRLRVDYGISNLYI